MDDGKGGLFGPLFDISFRTLVTPRIIKVLYALSMVAAGFISIVIIVEGFSESAGKGLLSLLFVSPLVFLILVISSRIVYELAIVVFRISDQNAEIAKNTADIAKFTAEIARLTGNTPPGPSGG